MRALYPLLVTIVLWVLWTGFAIFCPKRGPDDAAGLAMLFSFALVGTIGAWTLWGVWNLVVYAWSHLSWL